ncbi:MAG: hypothetical protein VB139_00735, partial [Coriobacteriia bacterium]|nr:hypothetical protein [Coriobacteriia bacterium]
MLLVMLGLGSSASALTVPCMVGGGMFMAWTIVWAFWMRQGGSDLTRKLGWTVAVDSVALALLSA